MNKRGFTLVELMITISIIAILAGMLFAVAGTMTKRQKKERTKMLLVKVEAAIHMYKNDTGAFPPATNSTATTSGYWAAPNNLWTALSTPDYLKESDVSKVKNVNSSDICDEYSDNKGNAYGTPLIYIQVNNSANEAANPSDVDHTFTGFSGDFELWSAGPDEKFSTGVRRPTSSSDSNYDNITVGKYAPGM